MEPMQENALYVIAAAWDAGERLTDDGALARAEANCRL